MIRHTVKLKMPGVSAESVYSRLINPTDDWYREWLPDEHWEFHIVKRGRKDHLGDLVFYDEILGTRKHRLVFHARVTVADRPNRIVYKMRKFGLDIPAYLDMRFTDTKNGTALRHELRVGWRGIGSVLNPLIRLYINKSFTDALEGHCKREWTKMAEIIQQGKGRGV